MSTIYHETQKKMLCAVHALNNLLQKSVFSKADLDAICKELEPEAAGEGPHSNSFGLGNYDINVMTMALFKAGYELTWFDRRRPLSQLNTDHVFGYLVNKPETIGPGIKMGCLTPTHHWMALRELSSTTDQSTLTVGDGVAKRFVNLDSKLPAPEFVADNRADFCVFLSKLFEEEEDVELMLVLTPEISSSKLWQL